MTAVLADEPLFTMPPREAGRGRLRVTEPGAFRGYCRQVTWEGQGSLRRPVECEFATTSGDALAAHMLTAHGVRQLDVPKPLKATKPRRGRAEDFTFEPKAWAPGATVEFDTEAGRRTGQVWSDAPPSASVWVVDAETGAAWCVKKDGYAIDMKWGGRA